MAAPPEMDKTTVEGFNVVGEIFNLLLLDQLLPKTIKTAKGGTYSIYKQLKTGFAALMNGVVKGVTSFILYIRL